MNRHVVRLLAETDQLDERAATEVLAHIDDVIDALEDIEDGDGRIIQCDISVSLHNHQIQIDVEVAADDRLEATSIAISAIRTAIHVAGGATPGWEDLIRTTNVEIDPSTDENNHADEADCVPA